MKNSRINFIVTETTEMHNEVAEAYEALMDGETKEAIKVLDKIAERARTLKADLLTKED
jgi:threonine dehydrogenase-like Zn-dependent dehydrogenase